MFAMSLSRQFAALLAGALLFALPGIALARSDRTAPPDPPVTVAREPAEDTLVEHGHYINRAGETVHSPAHTRHGERPEGSSARCRDGTYSFSRHRSGTCSHHGGVATWY